MKKHRPTFTVFILAIILLIACDPKPKTGETGVESMTTTVMPADTLPMAADSVANEIRPDTLRK